MPFLCCSSVLAALDDLHMSAFMAAFRGPNSELKKLPPYSPFLNIVKQAISALKLAIKADISRANECIFAL